MSYIRPEYNHYPLGSVIRLTQEEWEDSLNSDFMSGNEKIFVTHKFTMYQDAVFVPGWDYSETIDIYLSWKPCRHKACSKHMQFGPNKNPTLARANALKFLVEHGFVEIVSCANKEQESR